MIVICVCGKPFKTKPCLVARGQGKYCCKECSNAALLKGELVQCHVCETKVWRTPSEIARSKSKTFFCKPECRSEWNEKVMPSGEEHPGWKDGSGSYRQRALKHYGEKCSNPDCKVTKAGVVIPAKMLDVDHVDGNRKHNGIKNLKVLCVWCHAEKTRYAWK